VHATKPAHHRGRRGATLGRVADAHALK
jgi:hypothetical protein